MFVFVAANLLLHRLSNEIAVKPHPVGVIVIRVEPHVGAEIELDLLTAGVALHCYSLLVYVYCADFYRLEVDGVVHELLRLPRDDTISIGVDEVFALEDAITDSDAAISIVVLRGDATDAKYGNHYLLSVCV